MDQLRFTSNSADLRKAHGSQFSNTYASSQDSDDQIQTNEHHHKSSSYNLDDMENEADDIQIEEDYIMKLKTQRERIEKLQKTSVEKDLMLLKQVDRSKQLLEEVQHLAGFVPYQQKYEDLLLEKQQLERDYDKLLFEHKQVKEELSNVVRQARAKNDKLKSDLHSLKLTNQQIIHEFNEKLGEKEDQIKNIKNLLKHLEHEKQKQIKQLKTDQERLTVKLEENIYVLEKQCSRNKQQLRNKDQGIEELEKTIEFSKKSVIEMKSYIQKCTEQFQSRQEELNNQLAKHKHYLSQGKKNSQQLKTNIHELELALRKESEQKQQWTDKYNEIKNDFKKATQIYESSMKKKDYETSQEVKHLQMFIEELKSSIEELMDVKNCLLNENRRLVTILKKKEDIDRQRKQILRTQFKEINRIEKVIDRLE